MNIFLALTIIVIAIILEAFFSGSETAIISVNKIKLRHLVEARIKKAEYLQQLLNKPEGFLGTILVGTNLSVIISSAVFTDMVVRRLGMDYKWMATAVLTPLIIIFGEILPKAVFRQAADRVMFRLVGPLRFFSKLLAPVSFLAGLISESLLWPLRKKRPARKSPFVSREELKYLLRESEREGVIEPHERSIIYSIFEFSAKQPKQIMTPLRNAVCIEADSPLSMLKELVRRTGFTRIPVYKGDQSNCIGIVNIFDCLDEEDNSRPVSGFMRPVISIYEKESADKALLTLQIKRQRLAVVRNDDNKNVGIVSIEDLLEEIVGEM